jgi:16S rRNA (cytosine1402-N4)-methyltransferase
MHLPVLTAEVLAVLEVRPDERYIDATVGLGGHAERILGESGPDGRLLGIDADPDAIRHARARLEPFGSRADIVQGNFRDVGAIAIREQFSPVHGMLFDLGISSLQLGPTGRGFSFQVEAPLDMRMDPQLTRTAADLVNRLNESELATLLERYGEEPAARRVARGLVRMRPFRTTIELAAAVASIIPRRGAKTHPATRSFQALRIAVNGELENLERALAACLDLLRSGGRLAVISFHSLEDRIVKEFIRRESRDCICPPALPVCVCSHHATLRSPRGALVRPSPAEVAHNPRSRSATLRFAERL